MSDFNIVAIGQVITTVLIISGVLWGAVRKLLERNEERHQQTEEHLTARITNTETELTNRLSETKTELRTAIVHVQSDVDELEEKFKGRDGEVKSELKDLSKRIGWVEQRSAGVESAVFKRPPLLDDEIPGG